MVVAVGGDGAVNRMINLFEKSGVPMGLLPLGTSNDFAQALGISLDLDEACAVIRGALLKEVDIISVNGKSFVTCGGLGLASAAASRANGWKTRLRKTAVITRLLGKNIYALAALLESLALHRPLHACIHHNGNVKERDWVTLIIGNQPQLGGFTIPSSSNTDGLFHLSAVEYPDSRVRMLWMLWQGLRGRLDTCRHVTHEDARSISITTPDSSSFFGDGDILAHARHFRIEIRPRAIRVSVPRESMIPPQPSPSGPQPSRTEESEVRHG
jgi:diacylglycerol kinase (ATP)